LNPETRALPRADTLERKKKTNSTETSAEKPNSRKENRERSLRLIFEAMRSRVRESSEKFRLRQELRRERNKVRDIQRVEKRRQEASRKILEKTTKVEQG